MECFKKILADFLLKVSNDKIFTILVNIICMLLKSRSRIVKKGSKWEIKDEQYALPHRNRFLFYVYGLERRYAKLLSEYLVEDLNVPKGSIIVDCGANAGDFSNAIIERYPGVNIIAFEPGEDEYDCCIQNIKKSLFIENKALGDKTGKAEIFINNEHADNSLIDFKGSIGKREIDVIRLDEYRPLKKIDEIFLFKLEAEGYEPEILYGAQGVMKKIRYITVDVGFERGLGCESTLPQVVNFLCNNNFELVVNGRKRSVLLFKNIKIK